MINETVIFVESDCTLTVDIKGDQQINVQIEQPVDSLAYFDIAEVVAIHSDGTLQGQQSFIAAVPLSGGRLVSLTAEGLVYYDASNADDAFTLVGLSLNAGLTGDAILVQTSGVAVHNGLGLTANQIYLAGPNGTLLSNPSNSTSFVQIVGKALDNNSLLLSVQPLIFPI